MNQILGEICNRIGIEVQCWREFVDIQTSTFRQCSRRDPLCFLLHPIEHHVGKTHRVEIITQFPYRLHLQVGKAANACNGQGGKGCLADRFNQFSGILVEERFSLRLVTLVRHLLILLFLIH
jgi:hypothetical protein